MNIGKKTSFRWLIAVSVLFGFIFNATAAETPASDYERYYPKYVESKESLKAIQIKDVKDLRKSEIDFM